MVGKSGKAEKRKENIKGLSYSHSRCIGLGLSDGHGRARPAYQLVETAISRAQRWLFCLLKNGPPTPFVAEPVIVL
jgi:hypothetical protein